MYKHGPISPLIKVDRFALLIALLILIVDSQHVSAQQQLAQDAYAIFEGSCLICHGTDGAYRETLLIDHPSLVANQTVVPGNPDSSELYKRLLGPTDRGAQMPLGQPQLSAAAIDTIRHWIQAGAPDWTSTAAPLRRFVPPSEVLKAIDAHVNTISPFDRPFARYFTMTHLYNAGVPSDILGEYRKALAKLVNSLSWGLNIVNPLPIDPQQTIFYIDLRHYEWDRNAGWTEVEEAYPYHIEFNSPAQTALRNQLSRLQTTLSTTVPSVNADWFIASAASPPLYNALLSLPETDLELEDRLEVDVANNILTAPGLRVSRAGFVNSGVSNHNRVVERHNSRYGAYWKSYDFAGSVGTQNIFTHPLAFTHDGGEIIFNLPNGLQGYYLVDGTGRRLDEAPISIVSNPAASDPTVRNGLSCIGCHTEGMKEFTDEVRAVIESDTRPDYNKAHALQLYVEKSKMDASVNGDLVRYQRALQSTGGDTNDVEPVSRFHEAFHSPLDLHHASASVGLEPDVFLSKIGENAGLQSAGLLVLDGGQIKRDTWRSSFQDVIHALDYPQQVGEPPIVTQPEVIPGRLIDIPDPNLRALLEERLATKAIKPSTMATLTTLNAKERNISDITGLEFAVNLEELNISGNPISDFSPLSGCVNLVRLFMWGHDPPKTDLSPLANLTKLEILEVQEFRSDDLSFLTRLTNLRELQFYGGPTGGRGISPVSGLTKLRKLRFRHQNIEDISPLSNLIHLEWLDLNSNRISNIAPLRNLTKLEFLSLGWNVVEDVSPLAALTNLRELNILGNNISDISPLDVLLRGNLEPFEYYGNPAFENQGGPKIEGPWLWAFVPDVRLESGGNNVNLDSDMDLLSDASGGAVTERGVATQGAVEGSRIGNDVWTFRKLPPTGFNNIEDMLGRRLPAGVIYGVIFLYAPREQDTTMYVSSVRGLRVWLNGFVVCERYREWWNDNYSYSFPVTLQQGKNTLLVAIGSNSHSANGFFGFEPGTKYTLSPPGVAYVLSRPKIHFGDTFNLEIRAENVLDLAGWQFDVAYDPTVLEALDVSEGDFLKTDGGTTFFQSGSIDNAAGKITGLIAGRISEGGLSGSGSVLQVRLKAKSEGETELALQNFLFGSVTEESIPAGPLEFHITVEERLLIGDVNRDGVVNILDLIRVAQQLGRTVAAGSAVDINGDGVVNIFDLTLVAQGIGGTAAPSVATGRAIAATVEAWITLARLEDDGSIVFRQGIANLQNLLASLAIPKETALRANYPNPFNPETWIPYQLAAPAEVTLTIYGMNGGTIRRLEVGHQAAGTYQNRSRAVYWDGRNQRDEFVASGLYFYTLRAGDFTATRRMLIRK